MQGADGRSSEFVSVSPLIIPALGVDNNRHWFVAAILPFSTRSWYHRLFSKPTLGRSTCNWLFRPLLPRLATHGQAATMSAILSADDLNDFISPGVACIKPVETL